MIGRNFVMRLVRDNRWVNPAVRTVLKQMLRWGWPVRQLSNRYRAYGNLPISIHGAQFVMHSTGDDLIANELFYGYDYEAQEFHLLAKLLLRSNVFVDVGANTGAYSLFASSLYPELSIYSFEPNPANCERFLCNIDLSGARNINLSQQAVGASRGKVGFALPAHEGISATSSAVAAFSAAFASVPGRTVQVPLTTLDEALSDVTITPADVIKIDVEYYEVAVLQGAIKILRYKRPVVLIELLTYQDLTTQFPSMKGKISQSHILDIFAIFESVGYFGYCLEGDTLRRLRSPNEVSYRNAVFVPAELPRDRYEISTFVREFSPTAFGSSPT